MPKTIQTLGKFPFIKQNGDFCIPASIENVMKYHIKNLDVDQYKIVSLWRKKHIMESINIPKITTTLRRSKYRNNFVFEVGAIAGVSFNHDVTHLDRQGLINYAKHCCDDGNPLIVAIGKQGLPGAHMLVVIGYLQNLIMFFDPANKCALNECICYGVENWLTRHQFFHNNLTSLLIRPR